MHVLVCICSNVRQFRMITGIIHNGAEGGDAVLGVRVPPPPFVQPPRPPCPSPLQGGVTWPMNNKKSTGNHRRRRKILVGYTRIQITVVWCPSPPPGGGGNRRPWWGMDMEEGGYTLGAHRALCEKLAVFHHR